MSDVATDDVQANHTVTSRPDGETVNDSEEKAISSADMVDLKAKTNDGPNNSSEPASLGGKDIENGEKVEEDRAPKVDKSPTSSNEHKSKEIAPRYNRNNERKSKFDPSVLPVTDDSNAIRTQVEFYFSDSNLPTDKHMTNLAGHSGTKPVKIMEIHKFGRMQRFQPYSAVVSALRESQLLLISGPEGLETVRRKIPFDPNQKDEAKEARTIYAKGFGDELPTTQFDIEAFFAPYGPTNAVRLRRTDDKAFKGSCFIEFQDEQIAKKFLNLDPKPLWQGKIGLEIMFKRDYVTKKNEQLRSGEISPNKTRIYNHSRGRGGSRGAYRGGRDRQDKDNRDPDDWKKRREDDQKSGFWDNRDRKHRGHGGRGGRGRGRGDRGSQSNRRDHFQGSDRDSDRQKDNESAADETAKPTVQESSKKRVRENDEGGEETPAKKVDTKEEVSTAAS